MRDPKRINIIINKLRELWLVYPDMRFFQLLDYIANLKEDNFYVEDNIVEEQLDLVLKKVKK